VKFHLLSSRGTKELNQVQARLLAGEEPDWLSRDLKEAIDRGEFPSWTLCYQIMGEEDGYANPLAFDCTKVWPHLQYPLFEIGSITLNRNPLDQFTEVEQAAFSPLRVPPGIGFSPDKLLQGRLHIYDDAQYHRIGPNFMQLQVNKPRDATNTMYLGGNMRLDTKDNFPHYFPSSFGGPQPDPSNLELPLKCDGPAGYYDYPNEGSYQDYYKQPAALCALLNSSDKNNLSYNISSSLEKVPEEIVRKVLIHLNKIDKQLGRSVEQLWKAKLDNTAKKTEAELVRFELSGLLRSVAKSSQ